MREGGRIRGESESVKSRRAAGGLLEWAESGESSELRLAHV